MDWKYGQWTLVMPTLKHFTKEKVYIIAGPEFGPLEGHTLLINKAIYGLKSSGLRWSERFSDVLIDMGFFLSKAETDIWMCEKDGCMNTLESM
jgi:hypothetical protein